MRVGAHEGFWRWVYSGFHWVWRIAATKKNNPQTKQKRGGSNKNKRAHFKLYAQETWDQIAANIQIQGTFPWEAANDQICLLQWQLQGHVRCQLQVPWYLRYGQNLWFIARSECSSKIWDSQTPLWFRMVLQSSVSHGFSISFFESDLSFCMALADFVSTDFVSIRVGWSLVDCFDYTKTLKCVSIPFHESIASRCWPVALLVWEQAEWLHVCKWWPTRSPTPHLPKVNEQKSNQPAFVAFLLSSWCHIAIHCLQGLGNHRPRPESHH